MRGGETIGPEDFAGSGATGQALVTTIPGGPGSRHAAKTGNMVSYGVTSLRRLMRDLLIEVLSQKFICFC
jgi:hypothetical protein